MKHDTARRAALVLHAMPMPDREWLLGQLGESQRHQLTDLVDELVALGVEPDTRWLADRLHEPLPMRPAQTPTPTPTPVERLRGLGVEALQALLAHEPEGLLARLLQVEAWPWADALVAAMPAARRLALHRPPRDTKAPLPERLDAALCAALAARADTLPSACAEPGAPDATLSPWRSWWQRHPGLRRSAR